jgi:tRNA A-37 threonylcarbamoyl transferase component Bud32
MIFEDKEYDNNNKSGTGSKKEDDDDFNTFSSSALPLDKNKGDDNGNTKNEIMKKKGTKDNDNSTDGNMNNAKNVKEAEEDTQNMIFTATSSPMRNKNGKGNIKVNDNNDNDKDNASGDIKTKRYVTPQDFELLKVIGMGAFGKVLQVKNKHSQEILAMKVISKRLLKRKTTYIENIHAEREILTKAKHPFIVNMHCSFQTKEKLFIIMDFLAGGELFLRLGRQGIFLEKTAAFYIGEIVLALEHLHSRGILHRDLKPENILLSTDGHLCLTDFGLAKDFQWDDNGTDINEDGKALTVCGTQEYMAPEMVARKGYGKAADWWSLGKIRSKFNNDNSKRQKCVWILNMCHYES